MPAAVTNATASFGDFVRVVDVTDPTNPSQFSAWDSPGSAERIAIDGSIAYLADGPFGVQVIDVSVPASPRAIANLFDDLMVFDVARSANVLLIAAGDADADAGGEECAAFVDCHRHGVAERERQRSNLARACRIGDVNADESSRARRYECRQLCDGHIERPTPNRQRTGFHGPTLKSRLQTSGKTRSYPDLRRNISGNILGSP